MTKIRQKGIIKQFHQQLSQWENFPILRVLVMKKKTFKGHI